jgi:hypothetical protein
MIEPQKAPHGHWTTKPIPSSWHTQDENQSKKVLMTSMNKPTVRIMRPQDRNLRMGRMKIFTSPSTTAITAKASQAEVPWIDMSPDGANMKYATTNAITVISQWMKNLMISPFPQNLVQSIIRLLYIY